MFAITQDGIDDYKDWLISIKYLLMQKENTQKLLDVS
jgi:hypothetical protein